MCICWYNININEYECIISFCFPVSDPGYYCNLLREIPILEFECFVITYQFLCRIQGYNCIQIHVARRYKLDQEA